MIESFRDLPLSENTHKALVDMGFETPSPIQAQAIPFVLEGRDVVGQAQTGTGKTAAFGIPTVEMVDGRSKHTQALILCPTRELAQQVSGELKKMLKHRSGVFVMPIYGGESIEKQITFLRKGVQIVVGTPGRVIDHIERGTLKLNDIRFMVLDEADEMLNMGFRDDIEMILKQLPEDHQTMLFSATMAKPILDIAKKYLDNPEIVKVTRTELTTDNVEQFYFETKQDLKSEAATMIIDQNDFKLILVFCNTKKKVDEVVDELNEYGYEAIGIHGDLSQRERNMVMEKFRSGKAAIMVATDVAARGIDVKNVDAVINYDIPKDIEQYVHRIGRTGRAGAFGKAYSLVTKREAGALRDIENYIKKRLTRGELPTAAELKKMRQKKFMDRIANILGAQKLEKFYELVDSAEESGITVRDMAAAMAKMILGDDKPERERSERGDRDDRGPRTRDGEVRVFLNLGKLDNIKKGDIVGAVAGESGIDGSMINRIDIMEKFSFFNIPSEEVENVISSLKGKKIKGMPVNLEVSGAGGGGRPERREGGFRGDRNGGGRDRDRGGNRGGYSGRSERSSSSTSSGSRDRERSSGGNSGGGRRDRKRY